MMFTGNDYEAMSADVDNGIVEQRETKLCTYLPVRNLRHISSTTKRRESKPTNKHGGERNMNPDCDNLFVLARPQEMKLTMRSVS
jgi:hypothetical protein